jgi:hypothetical protein
MNPNRPGIVLAIALFATLGFTLFAGSPSRAGIRVDKVLNYVSDANDRMVRIQMHVYPLDGHGVDDSMDIKIEAPGETQNTISDSGGDFFSNKARTLVAFNIGDPGETQIFLMVQSGQGVQEIRDFGDRVGDLCEREHHPEFNAEIADVTKIVGDTVYLTTDIDYHYADKYKQENTCFATVRVAPDGQLSLTSYQLKRVKY